MGRYAQGDESKTLSSVHQYCQRHPDQSVIYLHNKGSYHSQDPGQTNGRRALTAAATSEMCLEHIINNEDPAYYDSSRQCNACSLLFQTLPAPHFPGNMWAASCSYVTKLYSPRSYHRHRQSVTEWIRRQQVQHLFSAELFPMESHYVGNNRYESEHRLGSHPDLSPCDVSPTADLAYWLNDHEEEKQRNLYSEFEYSLAPRHDISAGWHWRQYAKQLDINDHENYKSLRMMDFFLLRGELARWQAIYKRLPDTETSWVWDWYPDGEMWREGVKEHGYGAINRRLAKSLPYQRNNDKLIRSRDGQIWR